MQTFLQCLNGLWSRKLICLAATLASTSTTLEAQIDFSADLRYRATLFEDYGLYEKNRLDTDSSELEHEFRADLSLARKRHRFELRLGRRILDEAEFKRPPEEDVLSMHQIYLDFSIPGSDTLNLRLGRQELSYNRGILIDQDDWDMEGNSFDALKLYLDGSTWDLDVLYGQLAKDRHNRLAGINLERTSPTRTINEFYLWYFGIGDEQESLPLRGNPELDVYNFGTRMEGKLSRPIFYHWMINYQTGKMKAAKNADLQAYNLVANLDYFVDHSVVRNVGIEYSLSSGDESESPGRNETFIPPFANRHVRSGAMDWMSMMNAEMITLYMFADVHPKVEALIEFHQFYLHSQDSAWYVADLSPAWWWGSNNWPGETKASKDIGSELDVHLRFGKNHNRIFTAGYSLFFPGKLITDWSESHWGWGQKDTAQWAYLQTEFKF